MFLWWIWLPVLLAGIGFGVGHVLGSGASVSAEATAVLGVVDEVGYPFYEVVLARQIGLIEDMGLLAEAEQATGHQAQELVVRGGGDFSLATVELTVTASSPEAARALVEDLADRAIAMSVQHRHDGLRAERSLLESEIERLESVLAESSATFDSLSERDGTLDDLLDSVQAGDASESGEATDVGFDGASLTLHVLRQQIISTSERADEARQELAEIDLELLRPGADVEIVQRSSVTNMRSVPFGAVGATLGALLGLGFVPVVEQRWGRFRRADQVAAWAPDAALVDLVSREVIGGANRWSVVPLALAPGTRAVAAFCVGTTTAAQRQVLAELQAVLVPAGIEFTPVDVDRRDALDKMVQADSLVLMLPRGARIAPATRLMTELRRLSIAPDLVVFAATDGRPPSAARPDHATQ